MALFPWRLGYLGSLLVSVLVTAVLAVQPLNSLCITNAPGLLQGDMARGVPQTKRTPKEPSILSGFGVCGFWIVLPWIPPHELFFV